MQLSQPLPYASQLSLYQTTASSSYLPPNRSDQKLERSHANNWQKLHRLATMHVCLDHPRTGTVSVPELVALTGASDLAAVHPSFLALLSRLPQDKGRYQFSRCFKGLIHLNFPTLTQPPTVDPSVRSAVLSPSLFRGTIKVGGEESDGITEEKRREVEESLRGLVM